MTEISPEQIAAALDAEQRSIVLYGPESWEEFDKIPEGLFEYDESYDSETYEESGYWEATDLGKAVRGFLDNP